MFSSNERLYFYVILYVLNSQTCCSELVFTPSLVLYSPGDPEYTDVLVKRVHDNLTLVCELRGDSTHRSYVWNYVGHNGTRAMGERPLTITPTGPSSSSTLQQTDLQLSDSGQYMCSAPPFSVTKYVLVQTKGPGSCARGAFVCGSRCVLAAYVCDGRNDCLRGEDEDGNMCQRNICARPDKLNCSSGRCISSSACCRTASTLCRQPACCEEFYSNQAPGFGDEFPPLFEDRHAPDDYGFIQSTIYTVTACALIFMIAVVLLVSAICKMQMKRAALRGYSHADRDTRSHYSAHYTQAARFPPCYEASLLEAEGRSLSPPRSPSHHLPAPDECSVEVCPEPRGLARLSAIFSSRYRQVPTQPSDVELLPIPPSSLPYPHPPLTEYRSPACELESELFDSPHCPQLGTDLNYLPTPVDYYRRRNMRRNTLERVMDQLDRQRMTLQLGRFQLSVPRLRRGGGESPLPPPLAHAPHAPHAPRAPRADTPVVELVPETYTLNGRTITLLGADVQPPPYPDLRYKLYGPPPEYLSREALNRQSADAVDEEAATNIEMPPRYDDLTASDAVNGNYPFGNGNCDVVIGNCDVVIGNSDVVIGNCDVVIGSSDVVIGSSDVVNGNNDVANGNVSENSERNMLDAASAVVNSNNGNVCTSTVVTEIVPVHNTIALQNNVPISNVETLSSIIDNLPAIDSDVNANDAETGINNDHVVRDNVANGTVINV